MLLRALLAIALVASAAAGDSPPAPPLASELLAAHQLSLYSDLALQWMQEYLRLDTSNPPGNEVHAARWLKRIFDQEGIESRLFEYAPGRANVYARIRGSGAARPLILLNHMDVVTSDASRWKAPPFSGAVLEGFLYGRGAQDMKSEGLAHLMVMVMLARERPSLDRDIIFLAVADEEVDDSGSEWMIAQQRQLFGDAEFLITEGGENVSDGSRVRYVGVDVAEKSPFWLRLTARGRPGHGSRPLADSAPNQLVRALQRVLGYQSEVKLLPIVDEYLRAMAPFQAPQRAREYADVRQALRDPAFRQSVARDETLNYLLRNTVAITMFGGSQQTNVIPGEAWANLDVRLLPGEDPQQFLAALRRLLAAEPGVTVEPLQKRFPVANSSPTNTALFSAIRRIAGEYFPEAPVVPRLTSGYTENQMYRPLGIVCYGFSPYATSPEEGSTEHGDNERIRVEEVRRGFRVLYDLVVSVAGAQGL